MTGNGCKLTGRLVKIGNLVTGINWFHGQMTSFDDWK